MATTATPKTRAIATPGTGVGTARYHLYRMAYGRIKGAMDDGYYLEAITLIESIVSDRLESRITKLLGTDFSFKTLGALINKSKSVETDASLSALVQTDLDDWRQLRNEALHAMAKLANGDSSTWEDRMLALVLIAEDGIQVLKAIDSRCTALRKAGI